MTAVEAGRRVSLVTGGGGGIGAAIAIELARLGDHVVTLDPMVAVDGSKSAEAPSETTAERIVAAGGSAETSNASVTDADAVVAVVDELVHTHGRLDSVVNVAGISRPTGFARGTEADWSAVLAVHLDGCLNVLTASLPHLVRSGGAVLGVTSGSGWRMADAGAYSCAKRAVAALTWQLGQVVPAGVSVNAISPIAMTRMVTAALARAGAAPSAPATAGTKRRPATPRAATGGLSLGSMPPPEHLGPLAAALAGHGSSGVRGQVLFAGGPEVAVVDPPRLLEVVRTSDVASIDAVLAAFTETLVATEAAQATSGGANPRFGHLFEGNAPTVGASGAPVSVAIVSDRPSLASAVSAALATCGAHTTVITTDPGDTDRFGETHRALVAASGTLGGLDAVVVARASPTTGAGNQDWSGVLDSHVGLATALGGDAAWARACAELATPDRPLRLVQLVDATDAGGRSRAQAVAQLSRASRGATDDRVAAFTVAIEDDDTTAVVAAVTSRLLTASGVSGLAGAELVAGRGWFGLRSHPRPAGSIVFGGPDLPGWFDGVLGELAR